MTKIKEAVDNHKNYEKFHMETIVAHNGVLVDIVVSASYEETKFDKIINLFTGRREKREIA